jgi:hypothetical protein
MRRKTNSIKRFILFSVVTFVAILFISIFLMRKYPYHSVANDFSVARVSSWAIPWPISPEEDIKTERKKLRKFRKKEQERRNTQILSNMHYIQVPISDFFLENRIDNNLLSDTINDDFNARISPNSALSLPWPELNLIRMMSQDSSSSLDQTTQAQAPTINAKYVALPESHGSRLVESVEILPTQELKFSVPTSSQRRTFSFGVLASNAGTLRGFLGQYTWVRNFSDSEINKPVWINVPVNDFTSLTIKLQSNNFSGKILLPKITISSKSARLPIQVSKLSEVWKFKQVSAKGTSHDMADASEVQLSDTQPVEAQPKDAQPVEAQPKDAQPVEAQPKDAQPVEVSSRVSIFEDPTIHFNPQILHAGLQTTGVGYNLLVNHLSGLPSGWLRDITKQQMSKAAPFLEEALQNGLLFEINQNTLESSSTQQFQNLIVPSLPKGNFERKEKNFSSSNLHIAVENRSGDNLYSKLRNYGYQVVASAPYYVLNFPQKISEVSEIPSLFGRWLEERDWQLALKKKQFDEKEQPLSGLEAIFDQKNDPLAPPLVSQDKIKLASWLEGFGTNEDSIPDWKANEYFIPNEKTLPLQAQLEFFKKWTRDSAPQRFFWHNFIDLETSQSHAGLKEFLNGWNVSKHLIVTNPSKVGLLAKISQVEKITNYMISALKSKRILHRTVILFFFHSNNKTYALFWVPGLESKVKNQSVLYEENSMKKVSENNIVGAVLNFLGISTENSRFYHKKFEAMEEQNDEIYNEGKADTVKNVDGARQLAEFNIHMLPDPEQKNGCEPFELLLQTNPEYFEIPNFNVEWKKNSRRAKFFPCQTNTYSQVKVYLPHRPDDSFPIQILYAQEKLSHLFESYNNPQQKTIFPLFKVGKEMISAHQAFLYQTSGIGKNINSLIFSGLESEEEKKIMMHAKCAQSVSGEKLTSFRTCVWITQSRIF